MKKTGILLLMFLLIGGIAHAFEGEGIEEGDREISFFGMYQTTTGNLDHSFGNIQVRMGQYFTDKLLLGIAPGLQITHYESEYQGGSETTIDTTLEVYGAYNFVTNKRTIPYVKGSLYQSKTDIPDNQEFTDYSFLQVGFGVKNFFNEFASLDTSISYGISVGEGFNSGSIVLQSGLSFVF